MTKVVWKLEKLKCQNFKKCMFDELVIVNTAFSNLNILSANWPLLKLRNSIKTNVWYLRNLKDRHFVVDESKNLKLSANTCFGVSFQKNAFSSFLLFSSVCYQDDLSHSERNEIASSTARKLNSSWLLYFNIWEIINLCRNIWLIENWKCLLFLFLK